MKNLNQMAKEVTLEEGLKKSLSIAQVKEVMRIVFRLMAQEKPSDILKVLGL